MQMQLGIKRWLKLLVLTTTLTILASACATLPLSRKCPELILQYGWSDPVACHINGHLKTCRCMTEEDVQALRAWLIGIREGVCK